MSYEKYVERQKEIIKNNGNASVFARNSYVKPFTPNQEIIEPTGWRAYQSQYAFNPDLDTSEGLFRIAAMTGLEDKAKRAVREAGGHDNTFFSGGFVSDAFDLLNIGSYGMVGLFKGKGFLNGVRDRETFSDEDSLGRHGFTGKVLGFLADIAVDPLTYVAPWKVISKVPGVARGADSAKRMLVGETRTIRYQEKDIPIKREGGWTPLKFLGEKFAYGFAMDKKTLDGIQRMEDSRRVKMAELDRVFQTFSQIDNKSAQRAISWNGDVITKLTPEELRQQLLREMSAEEADKIIAGYKPVFDLIESQADELVDLGVLTPEARMRHTNDYIAQMYREYMEQKRNVPGVRKAGPGFESKARKDLTREQREEMGLVEDAGAVLAATASKQASMISDARMQDYLSKNLALGKEQLDDIVAEQGLSGKNAADFVGKNFTRVPESPRYEVRRNIQEKQTLKQVKKELNKVLKERRKAVGDNKELLSRISKIEKEVERLDNLAKTNLEEAISGYRRILREGGLGVGGPKKVPTTEGQKHLARAITTWLNRGSKTDRLERETRSSKELLREFMETDGGIALEKAFNNPRAVYQWRSKEEFFDAVRYPDRKITQAEPDFRLERITDEQGNVRIQRAEKAQRRAGELTQELEVLRDTNLKLVEDAVNKLEDDYADLLFKRQNILEAMNKNEMGNLSGKYVPADVWDMVKGTFEPKKEFGQSFVMLFKKAKVIWNPASYPRNAMSAMIQNWWKLGIGPWSVGKYYEAHRILKEGGPIMDEMREHGFDETTGQVNELIYNFLDHPDVLESARTQWGTTATEARKKFRNFDRWATKAYGHIDNVAKVAAFKYARERGVDPETALRRAYAATFNYSHVTPFVQRLRTAAWGVPFITFNLKAVPLVTSTLANAPNRISIFGKAKNSLFQAAGVEAEQEAEAQPAWMRDDAFMLRVPWKDSEGRSMYFDLSYILPVGAILTGEYLKGADPTDRQSFLNFNPVLQTIKELSSNRTFSGYKIFNETDDIEQVISDITIHVSQLALPPAASEFFAQGYKNDGKRVYGRLSPWREGEAQDLGPNERTYYQEAFNMIGLGVRPFDLDSYRSSLEWRRRENLSQLLTQNGVLQEFSNLYAPDDSPISRPEGLYTAPNQDPLGR